MFKVITTVRRYGSIGTVYDQLNGTYILNIKYKIDGQYVLNICKKV